MPTLGHEEMMKLQRAGHRNLPVSRSARGCFANPSTIVRATSLSGVTAANRSLILSAHVAAPGQRQRTSHAHLDSGPQPGTSRLYRTVVQGPLRLAPQSPGLALPLGRPQDTPTRALPYLD